MESHNPFPVTPTGFLIGSYFACILYGLHLTQIHHYFTTYSETLPKRLLVLWVWLLSTCQMIIIFWTGWRYFSKGTQDLTVWGEFLHPLSLQDALIPLMAFTAQLYFGRRAWTMMGRKRWIGALVVIIPTLTLGCGIALAVTARLWADDPFVSTLQWAQETKSIGTPSVIVAITWMGLSAATDGAITFVLIYHFRSHSAQSPKLVSRLVSLTLETVLLTHICGAMMCIIFLASPPAHRTDQDIFWILLEVITELYALSILFTINARRSLRKAASSGMPATEASTESMCVDFGVSGVERRVEGYQGDTPFGVRLEVLGGAYETEKPEPDAPSRMEHEFSSNSSGSETKAETPAVGMRVGQHDYAFLPSVTASTEPSSHHTSGESVRGARLT